MICVQWFPSALCYLKVHGCVCILRTSRPIAASVCIYPWMWCIVRNGQNYIKPFISDVGTVRSHTPRGGHPLLVLPRPLRSTTKREQPTGRKSTLEQVVVSGQIGFVAVCNVSVSRNSTFCCNILRMWCTIHV